MQKKFNTTGNCYADKHYMMDNSKKIAKVYALVAEGHYFSINRPRQYGKTTTLFAIENQLQHTDIYLPIRLNFQGIDQKWHETDAAFAQMFVEELAIYLEFIAPDLYLFVQKQEVVTDMNSLSRFITRLVHFCPKKLVLLIDEVDASSNYTSFLSFLGMLRTKYLDRNSLHNYTFHSVVLVGVHDVKSLKFKLRNPEAAQFNSPWNIAIDFEEEMEFLPAEISPMLVEYAKAENVAMNYLEIAEKLYYYTSGYPFLVSRLCQIIAEKILPNKEKIADNRQAWTINDIESAVLLLQKEVNTNFESLIKNLENNKDLYDLVFAMLINGQKVTFNPDNATIHKGIVYGVFKQNGETKIHNRIYEQRIYNYLISNIEMYQKVDDTESLFLLPNGSLDFEKILLRFQAYIKENFGNKEKDFFEKEWRLVFLAFIRPIINGKGFDFKETQISDEKRLDVVISYGKFKYIVELKIWRGELYHQRGIAQLHDYLEIQGVQTGFLVIFDQRREQVAKSETIRFQEKQIFAIWI
jgi:hypothetical protein